MKKILIIGAGGQIGSELTTRLRSVYGNDNVVATDMRECPALAADGPFVQLNALDGEAYAEVVKKYKVDAIYNLVALLSAVGEANPQKAWQINMGALMNSLEIAREYNCALFTPSSIGAFGPNSPKEKTPQDTVMRPTTIYGVCKVTGELLGDYYHQRFGVDTRSVRFPGLISNVTLPGGGTTDYAVEIYYEAVKKGSYVCPIPSDVYMDMMYMPDALDACIQIMEADPSKLVHRNSFNVTSMSFTPEMLYAELRKAMPDLRRGPGEGGHRTQLARQPRRQLCSRGVGLEAEVGYEVHDGGHAPCRSGEEGQRIDLIGTQRFGACVETAWSA